MKVTAKIKFYDPFLKRMVKPKEEVEISDKLLDSYMPYIYPPVRKVETSALSQVVETATVEKQQEPPAEKKSSYSKYSKKKKAGE